MAYEEPTSPHLGKKVTATHNQPQLPVEVILTIFEFYLGSEFRKLGYIKFQRSPSLITFMQDIIGHFTGRGLRTHQFLQRWNYYVTCLRKKGFYQDLQNIFSHEMVKRGLSNAIPAELYHLVQEELITPALQQQIKSTRDKVFKVMSNVDTLMNIFATELNKDPIFCDLFLFDAQNLRAILEATNHETLIEQRILNSTDLAHSGLFRKQVIDAWIKLFINRPDIDILFKKFITHIKPAFHNPDYRELRTQLQQFRRDMLLTQARYDQHLRNYNQRIDPERLACLSKICFSKKRNLIFSTVFAFILMILSTVMLTLYSTISVDDNNSDIMYLIFIIVGIIASASIVCCCLSGADPKEIIHYLSSCLYVKRTSLENREYALDRKKQAAIATYRNARRAYHAGQMEIEATEAMEATEATGLLVEVVTI